MMPTNPNGANQYQMDPRQKLLWDSYINPKSETFSNAYKSALVAGYEEVTARQITGFDWFKEKQIRNNLLSKAEKVLDETLQIEVQYDEKGLRHSANDRVRLDAAKFVAQTRGKEAGYENGGDLTVNSLTQILNAFTSTTGIRPEGTVPTLQGRPGETVHSDEGSAEDIRSYPDEGEAETDNLGSD